MHSPGKRRYRVDMLVDTWNGSPRHVCSRECNRWCSHFNLDRRFPSHVSLPESEATLILSLPMCPACPDRGNAAISACEEFGRWAGALHLLSVAESMELQWKHIIHGWNIDLTLRCHQTWLGNPLLQWALRWKNHWTKWIIHHCHVRLVLGGVAYAIVCEHLHRFGLCYDWSFMDM